MSEPYIGEIKIVAFDFAPKGWAHCDGQFMQINQNQALFSLLGTMYGGDGRTIFALPDFRGRMIIGEGTGSGLMPRRIGERGGREVVTLTPSEMPLHTHETSISRMPLYSPEGNISDTVIGTFKPNASTQRAIDYSPTGKIPAASQTNDPDRPLPIRSYIDPSEIDTKMDKYYVDIDLNSANLQIGDSGGGQSFNNMQPYLALKYIIALEGIYPQRN